MQLEISCHRLQAGTVMIPIVVAERLRRDDRLLLHLEKLATGLTGYDGSEGELTDRSMTLCKALATSVAEGIRCRLDRIYMETLSGKDWQATEDTDLCSSVQEEMNSLYSEIAAVAEMSVNNEFENPLLDQSKLKQGKEGDYASSVLDFVSRYNITQSCETHRW